MKIPRKILQVSAVCSSLLLAGGLIAYKSGGLPWASPLSELNPQMSGSKSYKFSGLVPAGDSDQETVLLPGSKRAGALFEPQNFQLKPPESLVLSGSKSYTGVISISPEVLPPISQQTQSNGTQIDPSRTVLPGSKTSGPVIVIGAKELFERYPYGFLQPPPAPFSTAKPPGK